MDIPTDRSEYLPGFPFKATRAILVVLGLCLLVYSVPVTGTFDQVDPVTRSTSVPLEYTTTGGETEYGTFDIQITTPTTGVATNGSVRIRMQTGWGNPYANTESPPRAPLEVAVIAAPTSWRPERAAREGTVLFANTSTYEQGEYATFERVLHLPASIAPKGVGPTEATLYYYAASNAGTNRFEILRTYTVYRPFWERPRAWGLLAAIVLLGATLPTFNQSVRNRLAEPVQRYADRQWRQDLLSKAQRLDDKFDTETTASAGSPVEQSIQAAPRENLQDWSQRLEQFAVLDQTLSRLPFEELPVARTKVRSLAAQTWSDNDPATASDLNDVLTGIDIGFEVRIRGQSYDGAKLLDQTLADFPSSEDDQLEQAAAEINRFEDARATVEQWSQPSSSPADSGKSKLAVRVDSQVVEPTAIWERLDTILTEGTLDQFCEQAKAVEDFAAKTEPLRSNSGSSHPLSAGQAQDTTIEDACNAVREGDLDAIEKAMVKAEAWVAEQEVAQMFATTDLSHSSIDPTDVQNRVDQARATNDYTRIKSIRDEVMAQLDSTWQPSDLLSLTPTQFEEVLGQLYQRNGYDVQVTQQSGDRGIDAIARNGQRTIAIQAKRYDPNGAGNVSGPEVRNAIGATVQEGADVCVVATSSGFTQDARRAAMETKGVEVQLLSGRDVIEKLSKSQIPNPT
ncbi:restriction endonuclease [Haloferax sp. Atlit-24N]|uniref:restriction endonuclease n=1 Tax=Haloferax sp. Atlit-24N TaxID=2077200 RepID=UPI000E285A27|nr:restriction endonuclease [Haloferax sp. Atlit-24N]RDZ32151.1 hypothetical protein C5B88_19110 [Haloferax sp. Atlit-24N]RLM33283.1 restriction endonuclease [Haloferax sp. Atlit-109R]RLM40680.1 restriction endonuclease [Haloferax sp. Atlit-105R]